MAVIANLDVNLRAMTGQFTRGMLKAEGAVTQFTRNASRMVAGLTVLGLGVAAVTGAVGLLEKAVGVIGTKLAELDELGKAADKLGIVEGKLVSLRLAAAEFSGFSAGQFDTALQRMTRRVAEAAAGTGEAQGALRELGIDARALATASPDRIFRTIAEAMREVGSEGDALRLAFKLFDSEGAGLVSTLRATGDELEDITNFIADSGLLFTSAEIQIIEDANDAMGRFGVQVDGIVSRVTLGLSPALERVTEQFTGINDAAINAAAAGAALGFVLEATANAFDMDTGTTVEQAAENFVQTLADLANASVEMTNSATEAFDAAADAADAAAEVGKREVSGTRVRWMNLMFGLVGQEIQAQKRGFGLSGRGRAGGKPPEGAGVDALGAARGAGMRPAALDIRSQAGRSAFLRNQADRTAQVMEQLNERQARAAEKANVQLDGILERVGDETKLII